MVAFLWLIPVLLGGLTIGCRSQEEKSDSGPSGAKSSKPRAQTKDLVHQKRPGLAQDRFAVSFDSLSMKMSMPNKNWIAGTLSHFEMPIRHYNPKLFDQFNGWVVDSDEKMKQEFKKMPHNTIENGMELVAFYDPESRTVVTGQTLSAYGHEFCHYLDHRHRIHHGVFASAMKEWQNLSCANKENPLPEQCMDHSLNFRRGAHEEWANVCLEVLGNPAAAFIKYSDVEETRMQVEHFSKVFGFPSELQKKWYKERIKSWQTAVINSDEYSPFLTVTPETHKEYFEGKLYKRIFKMGHGTFGHLANAQTFQIYFPSDRVHKARSGKRIPLPAGLRSDQPFVADSFKKKIVFGQGDKLWIQSADGAFKKVTLDQTNFIGANAAWFGNGVLVMSWQDCFQVSSDGNINRMPYPEDIKNELDNARHFTILSADDKQYLWVQGINNPGEVLTSKLYLVEQKEKRLHFKPEFQVPVSKSSQEPFFYIGDWYLPDYVRNFPPETFKDGAPGLAERFVTNGFPIFLRIKKNGHEIHPIKLRYEGKDEIAGSYLAMLLSAAEANAYHVSGDRIVVPIDAKERIEIAEFQFQL